MTGLPVGDRTKDILDISVGIILNQSEKKAAGFTLKINDKFVMMTADASPTVFNQAIKTALQRAFSSVLYDCSAKEFEDPMTLFQQYFEEEDEEIEQTYHKSQMKKDFQNFAKESNIKDFKVSFSTGDRDLGSLEVSEDTGEITEAQAKGIQEDLEKNGFPFDYPPPQEDYNQIPPNDIPEAMFDTLKTGSTEQPKWKPNVQRMQKVSR